MSIFCSFACLWRLEAGLFDMYQEYLILEIIVLHEFPHLHVS